MHTLPPHRIHLAEPKWIKEEFKRKIKPSTSPTRIATQGKGVGERKRKKDTLVIFRSLVGKLAADKEDTSNLWPFFPADFQRDQVAPMI